MKHKFFRYFAYTLEMIVLFILERTQNAIPEVFGEKPTLVILVVLMIAFFEGESAGLIFGLLAGILLDSAINTQLSYLTMLMAIIGYIVGFISRNVISVNFTTTMLVSTASTVLIYMIIFVANYALKGYGQLWYVFWRHYLLRAIYSLIVLPLVYYLNRPIAMNINEPE